jgi:LysM repeat protein
MRYAYRQGRANADPQKMNRLMKFLKLFLFFVLFVAAKAVAQQPVEAVTTYINQFRDLAIEEMQRSGVPASIILAQGILETEAGRSELVLRSNNHFGIKCKTTWNGEKVYHDDDARQECFRKYASAEDSYIDHSNYLKNTPRYASLFKLDPTDYKGWSYGLKSAGYATNPKYPQILIKYIEQYNLNDYTLIAMGRKSRPDDMTATQPSASPEAKGTKTSPFLDNISISTTTSPASAEPPVASSEKAVTAVYPENEFKINNTRVVYVKAGTSLLSVAEKYDVRYSFLLDFNEIKEGTGDLQKDQLIYLQRKRKQGQKEYHIVQEGEDLYTISQEEGLRLESLLNYNQLSMNMNPAPGEKLYLQQQGPSRPRLASAH